MAYVFSNDTILKCFALVFDGLSAERTSQVMSNYPEASGRVPTRKTIENWAKKGEITSGIDWYVMRDAVSTLRVKQALDTAVVRKKSKGYEQWLDDTYSDIDELQDLMMKQLVNLRFSAGDIATLTKTRLVLDQASGQRYEQSASITRSLAEIIKQSFRTGASLYPASEESLHSLEFTLQAIQDEFARYLTEGSPDDFEVTVQRPATRRISTGTGRNGGSV